MGDNFVVERINFAMASLKKENVVEEFEIEEIKREDEVREDVNFKRKVLIAPLIFHVTMHLLAIYGFWMHLWYCKWLTIIWGWALGFVTAFGVICGAHRGWAHKSYKQTPLLKAILLTWQTIAGQNSGYTWARDHRIHHKYSDTDADPHNAARGFLFSHIGWLVMNKHPSVIEKGKILDVSDLKSDKLLMFQHNLPMGRGQSFDLYRRLRVKEAYFVPLYIFWGLMVPILVPYYMWDESIWMGFLVPLCFRYVTVLNITWCVNSFAHKYGNKPYDDRIRGVQSKFVWTISLGDGWHNYHHCFPWDYRSSEFGSQGGLSTNAIDFFHWLGLAYDLRTATPEIIRGHAKRHGDGTHYEVSQKAGEVKGLERIWMSGLGIIDKADGNDLLKKKKKKSEMKNN